MADISNQVYVNKAYKNVMNIILKLRNGLNCEIDFKGFVLTKKGFDDLNFLLICCNCKNIVGFPCFPPTFHSRLSIFICFKLEMIEDRVKYNGKWLDNLKKIKNLSLFLLVKYLAYFHKKMLNFISSNVLWRMKTRFRSIFGWMKLLLFIIA